MLFSSKQSLYLNVPPGPAGDPYWSNVVTLLKFDNNWTDSAGLATVTLSSSSPSWTYSLSSTQSKFGGYSAYVGDLAARRTGNGIQLSYASTNTLSFGTGDFTIELWCWHLLDDWFNWGIFNFNNINTLALGAAPPASNVPKPLYGIIGGTTYGTTTATMTPSQWNHIAFCRASGTVYIAINGVVQQMGTGNTTNLIYTTPYARIAASNEYQQNMRGYIDSFRITKGVARYTSNFTIPTEEWPTF
jgi:hypothetical protein